MTYPNQFSLSQLLAASLLLISSVYFYFCSHLIETYTKQTSNIAFEQQTSANQKLHLLKLCILELETLTPIPSTIPLQLFHVLLLFLLQLVLLGLVAEARSEWGHRERVVCAVGEVHVILVIPRNSPMTDEAVSNLFCRRKM